MAVTSHQCLVVVEIRPQMAISASRTLALLGGRFRPRISPKSPISHQFSSISLNSRRIRGIPAGKSKTGSSFSSITSQSFFQSNSAAIEGESRWTAVLLGWLGAEHKHLRRYAEMYGARGIRTVSFVVPVGELIFDLGKGIEGKIARFADELADWAEGEEGDGNERRLLFHTFSNTGWFTYGAILDRLSSRKDVLQKIRGCVVDSGADPEINPKVWAAGFSAALFKKRGSAAAIASEEFYGEGDDVSKQAGPPDVAEVVVLSVLEKFFSVILGLPDVNRRVSRIISILSKDQPPCPQLYLYSSADRVIPASSIEMFIETQKSAGREVYAHNFQVSPHVDHLRSFPLIYSSKLNDFLEECAAPLSPSDSRRFE